jgi:RimJ/RimL family protein N-acetyltransferase
MSIKGLQGERVRLVPPERERHLENALRWLNDPEITATLKHNLGVTRRDEEAFFAQIESRQSGKEYVWAIHDAEDLHVGFIGLHGVDWRHRSGVGGVFLGEQESWGKGFATDAVRVRTRYAFETLGLHRVSGHTMNPAMKRVYEKCGYHYEGRARDAFWRNGRWQDAELFAVLSNDPWQST